MKTFRRFIRTATTTTGSTSRTSIVASNASRATTLLMVRMCPLRANCVLCLLNSVSKATPGPHGGNISATLRNLIVFVPLIGHQQRSTCHWPATHLPLIGHQRLVPATHLPLICQSSATNARCLPLRCHSFAIHRPPTA